MEDKLYCPFANNECRTDCALRFDDELASGCAFSVIADQLIGGSIGIKTYGGESVCVTTKLFDARGGFAVDIY